MAQKIKCPNCESDIEVTEVLSLEIKKQLEEEFSAKSKIKDQKLKMLQEELENKEKKLVEDMELKIQDEKKKIWAIAQEKAKEKMDLEFKDLKEKSLEQEKALLEAQEKELEFRKKQRELETKEKTMQLELERKLDLEREKISEETKKLAAEEQRMKMLEKDKQLDQMRRQIEDLKRKSEQGSMQIQGDAQEEDLKNTLSSVFIFDLVEDVPTGINGADLVQTVNTQSGKRVGVILWESKNTKAWSDKWLTKLKDDQVKAKADICILVSQVLPEGIDCFGMLNGVWISDYKSVIPLTHALRLNLIQLEQVKNSVEGRDEKMAILYKYLSGAQFKNRIENIVTAFTSLKSDLETEKRAMIRIWSKREKEIERVVMNTTGMYGDLQGIIGATLATVENLELDFDDLADESDDPVQQSLI